MPRKMIAMMLSVKSQADEGQWEPNGIEELPTQGRQKAQRLEKLGP